MYVSESAFHAGPSVGRAEPITGESAGENMKDGRILTYGVAFAD